MRLNRCQPSACYTAIAAQLGEPTANALLASTQIADLPAHLPSGPRDAAQLAAELRPFATLYRALLSSTDRETALAIIRQSIIDSGSTSHAESASDQPLTLEPGEPLVLTSPPPPGFTADPLALSEAFDRAMHFFSCEGELLRYTPDVVRFTVTSCNWCHAMHAEGTPELIPFFCETDERFMDGHPTHRLVRPTAIGLGDTCCDFQFVRIAQLDSTRP